MFLSPLQVHLCSFEVYPLTRSLTVAIGLFSIAVICGGFSPEIHINGIAWYSLLYLAAFIYHNAFEMLLCCLMHRYFIFFYCWMAFHCTKLPWLVYWFTNWWKFELFPAIISKSTMTNHIYMFVRIYMFISLVLIHWSEMTKLFFQSDCIILHAHNQQQYVTIWVIPHYCQHRHCWSFSF